MRRVLSIFSLCIAGWIIPHTVQAQCTASYTWSQPQNNQIAFTPTISPASASGFLFWDFGDQSVDYVSNPTHTYNVPGTYVVCLYVTDSLNSCQTVFCDTITVTGTQLCNLSSGINTIMNESCSGCSDGIISADAYGGTPPYTFTWSNGGNTPTITGLSAGVYSVTISDANGCTTSDTFTLGIAAPNSCQARFTWSQPSNNVIDFTNTSTSLGVPFYYWDFGDQMYAYNTATTTNTTHTYSVPGTYTVCLSMFDSTFQCQTVFCDTVVVTGTVICNLGAQILQINGESCSGCSDGQAIVNTIYGTPPFTYSWSNGDNSPVANGLTAGTYFVTVTDANGCTASNSITISLCQFNFIWSQSQNNVIDFVNNSNPSSIPSYSYWDFGDGNSGFVFGDSTSHTYTNPGTYYVCATIIDSSASCSSTVCDSITVTGVVIPGSCDANFTYWMDSTFTGLMWIWNQSTGSQSMEYLWNWGDNTTSSGPYPTHSYAQSGLYTICLTVTDTAYNCIDSLCIPIQVARSAQQSGVLEVNVIGGTLGINNSTQEQPKWSIFPNPADQELQVRSTDGLNGRQFSILDMTGRTLEQASLSSTIIDISNLASGIYFIRIENERGGFDTQRFVKK
jgi:PKD repeat protein